ncbi:hypothetical protein PoB_007707800 [Plakobranchus ocellatus]|uniref:Uncharacterized protein n=1 Tax=Plakobranchus ocellatus TaxID=259542 RepID=A0AAV4E2Q6_9GAST|nr:hypothetical protein PoB_007707800 [Plakobranchus ocellatus]
MIGLDYQGEGDTVANESALRSALILLSWVGDVGGTVTSESALRSAGTLLSWFRAPTPTPRSEGGPESLRSPCCGLAIHKNQIKAVVVSSPATDAPAWRRRTKEASPEQDDLRLSGSPSGQGAGGRARTRYRRVPAYRRAVPLSTVTLAEEARTGMMREEDRRGVPSSQGGSSLGH